METVIALIGGIGAAALSVAAVALIVQVIEGY